MTEPQIGVVITLKDVYDKLIDVGIELTKVTTHIGGIDTRNLAADLIHADHETRLRNLENRTPDDLRARLAGLEAFRSKLLGLALVDTLLSGSVGALVGWLLTRK